MLRVHWRLGPCCSLHKSQNRRCTLYSKRERARNAEQTCQRVIYTTRAPPPEWSCHSRTPTRDRSTTPCSPIHPQTPRHTSTLPTARAGSSTVAVHPRVPNPSLLLLHLRTSICPGRVSTRRGRICGGTGGRGGGRVAARCRLAAAATVATGTVSARAQEQAASAREGGASEVSRKRLGGV